MINVLLFIITVLLASMIIYMIMVLPAVIAFNRRHRHKWTILAVTIFGGWLILPWFGALIWAIIPSETQDAHADPEALHREQAGEWKRRPSDVLILGIILMPIIYAWATLRKGYSAKVRLVSIGYAVLTLILMVISVQETMQVMVTMKAQAAEMQADARYAIENNIYMVTSPEELIAGLEAGRDADFRRHILLLDGVVVSMTPKSGHTDIRLRGRQGMEIMVNGDYLVGMQVGDSVSAGCPVIIHFGPLIQLAQCMVGPQGQLPIPSGATVRYGPIARDNRTSTSPSEDIPAPPRERPETVPRDQVIPFGRTPDDIAPNGSDEGGSLIENPFRT